jgi:hypothetical protein
MPPGSVLTKLSTAALPEAVSVSASNTRVDTLSVLMEHERHTEC